MLLFAVGQLMLSLVTGPKGDISVTLSKLQGRSWKAWQMERSAVRSVFRKRHDSDSHEHTACAYKAYPKAKPSNIQKAWGSEGDWLERRKPAREEEGYGKVVRWVSTVRVQLCNVGRSSQREISPPLELCEPTVTVEELGCCVSRT